MKRLPFILSVAIHLAIIIALIAVSPVTSYRLDASAPNTQPVVHAAVIDSAQVSAQVQAIQMREAQQQAAQQQKVQQLQAQAEAARQAKLAQEQRLAQIKANQQQAMQQLQTEQQHLAQLQAQQKQQQEAQAKALALKKQQQAEQAKALALKKQQQAIQAKAQMEKKQQELAAAKQKQVELAAKQNTLQQQLMQQQIASDQAQLAKAQQMQGVIDQYRARILMAIANQWLIPDGVDPAIFCVYTIDLTPAGVVSHAQLVRSSGNAALDRAAETAIYKASPLPVPNDPQVFAPFRHFTLKMTPQDIRR